MQEAAKGAVVDRRVAEQEMRGDLLDLTQTAR
jgi:hypothetical protein